MAKVKYYFNPRTLNYERYRPSLLKRISSLGGFLVLTICMAIVLLATVFNYYDTPKERVLKSELSQFKGQYEVLNRRLANMQQTVSALEHRDDNIYRVLFEAEPLSKSVRMGGFGGIDRYSHLQGFNNSEIIIETTQIVDQLENQLRVLSRSFDEISNLAFNKEEKLSAIPAIQPLSNDDLRRIASGYGPRMHPVYKTVRHHDGLDFSAPTGTPVYATGNGTVTKAQKSSRGYGNHIVINHGFGYETLYAHLHEINVKQGQTLKRGELIGTVGNTGLSVAPHLHYEVVKDGRNVDPINYFHNDLTPEEYQTVVILANQANQSLD